MRRPIRMNPMNWMSLASGVIEEEEEENGSYWKMREAPSMRTMNQARG